MLSFGGQDSVQNNLVPSQNVSSLQLIVQWCNKTKEAETDLLSAFVLKKITAISDIWFKTYSIVFLHSSLREMLLA